MSHKPSHKPPRGGGKKGSNEPIWLGHHPLLVGLLDWYPMNEGMMLGGNPTSINRVRLTPTAAWRLDGVNMGYTSNTIRWPVGYCIFLDDDVTPKGLITSGFNYPPLVTMTVMTWVRPVDFAFHRPLVRCTINATNENFGLYLRQTSGVIGFQFSVSGVSKVVNGATAVPTSTATMTHVAATYDKQNMRVYFNGRLDGTTAETGTPDAPAIALGIGHTQGGIGFPKQDQGQSTIYNRALHEGEIRQFAENPNLLEDIWEMNTDPGPPEFGDDAPPLGTGLLSGGSGSLLAGVSQIYSTTGGSVIGVGSGPLEGAFH